MLSMKLTEKQWNLIHEIALKIHSTENQNEMRKEFLVFVQALFDFDRAVFYLYDNGDPYDSPVCINLSDKDIEIYLRDFRDKDPFEPLKGLLLDSHSAIRSSDYSLLTDVEKTEYYKQVWGPKKIRYSLYVPLAYKKQWLGSISFFRTDSQEDFTDAEMQIINILKEHMQIRLYKDNIQSSQFCPALKQCTDEHSPASGIAAQYSLTRRECDVINLWTKGYTDAEICEILSISKNTLKKHISNIYGKTEINNRIELLKLIP